MPEAMLNTIEATTPQADDSRLPGDINIWVFVLGDMVIFAVYFIVFMVYRIKEPALFLGSQRHLLLAAGAVNTLALLTSSRFVALGVRSARRGDTTRARRSVAIGAAFGVLFLAIKAFEWHHEIAAGFTLPRNDFFMFYYLLTGVHLLHVFLGLGVLGVAGRELGTRGARRVWVVESCATYWHMVDLLWVVIFALVYVMR